MDINFDKADELLSNFKDMDITDNSFVPVAEDIDSILSPERLEKIKKDGDLVHARLLEGNDNRISFDRFLPTSELLKSIQDQLTVNCIQSGFFWYPYGGYCGWHTNNNSEGERIYLVWAQDEGKSFFRYQNPDTKEIVTSWDKKGWQLKRFTISKEKALWHCVGSKTNRISIGFKVI